MKLIGVGDNVVDVYLDQGIMYPGGNALNVAVLGKRYGMEACSYLGLLGNDFEGDHIIESLIAEGIDTTRIRRAVGDTGKTKIALTEEGDRTFSGSNKGGIQKLLTLRLTEEDLQYIYTHDMVHSSVYSYLEHELHKIKDIPVSFDFSMRHDSDYLQLVCPHLMYAFFSGSHLTLEECFALIETVSNFGVKIIGITRGSEGAIFSENGHIFRQQIVPTAVLDTLGAGDSFIATFLTHYHPNQDMESALQKAAVSAAETCGYYGAFGYGIEDRKIGIL
jgi:fructoselysine 6-kinase